MDETLRREILTGPLEHPAWQDVLDYAITKGIGVTGHLPEEPTVQQSQNPESSVDMQVSLEERGDGKIVEHADFAAFAEQQGIRPAVASLSWSALRDIFIEKLAHERGNTAYLQGFLYADIPLRYRVVPEPREDSGHIDANKIAGLEVDSLEELLSRIELLAAEKSERVAWRHFFRFHTVRIDVIDFITAFVNSRQVDSSDK